MKTKFDIFITGKLIDLIALNEDLALNSTWYSWFNDEEVTEILSQHYYPNSPERQLQFYRDNILNNPSKCQLGVLHKEAQEFIGVISLNDIQHIHRCAEISGGLIAEKKYRNIKFFVEANQLMMAHAFDTLNIYKLWGGSIRKELTDLYCRTLGFSMEGIRRGQIYKNGKQNDVYSIGITREDYYAYREGLSK